MSSPVSWEDYATGPSECAPEYASLWDGLVGLWAPAIGPTGNALFDLSGRGNNGVLTNMDPATDWVGGEKGWALDFVRTSTQSVNITTGPSVHVGTSDFSISMLVQPASGTGENFIDQRNTYSPLTGWQCGADNSNANNFCFEINGATRIRYAVDIGMPVRPSGALVAYTLTCSRASVATVYRNGTAVGSINISSSVAQNVAGKNPIKIGGHHTDKESYCYSGQFVVVALHHRALSASEASAWSADPLGLLRPAQQSPALWYVATGGGATVYATALAAQLALGSHTVTGGGMAQAGSLTVQAVMPGSTVSGGALATVDALLASVGIPSHAATGGAVIVASPAALAAAMPGVAVTGGAVSHAVAMQLVSAIGAAQAAGGASAVVSPLTGGIGIPGHTVTGGATVSAQAMQVLAAMPSASAQGAAAVLADPMSMTYTLGTVRVVVPGTGGLPLVILMESGRYV